MLKNIINNVENRYVNFVEYCRKFWIWYCSDLFLLSSIGNVVSMKNSIMMKIREIFM